MKTLGSVLVAVDSIESGKQALDKAVDIAARFDANIDLLIADVRNVAALAAHCAQLDYARITICSLHRDGEPLNDLILRKVAVIRPDLVIKAPQDAVQTTPGPDDLRLASQCQAPLLLAGPTVWAPSPRFAVALEASGTDARSSLRGVLSKAAFLARGCQGSLDLLCSEREEPDETVRMEQAVHLARLMREFYLGSDRLQMLAGPPEVKLPPLLAARQYDLLVLGVPGHGSCHAVGATQGDLLLIGTELPPCPAARPAGISGRQKVPHEREQFV